MIIFVLLLKGCIETFPFLNIHIHIGWIYTKCRLLSKHQYTALFSLHILLLFNSIYIFNHNNPICSVSSLLLLFFCSPHSHIPTFPLQPSYLLYHQILQILPSSGQTLISSVFPLFFPFLPFGVLVTAPYSHSRNLVLAPA